MWLTPFAAIQSGLGSADITRNFFASDIPLDAYNTENIEIQRGPRAGTRRYNSAGGC